MLEKDPDDICMVWVGVQEAKMNPKIIKKRKGANQLEAIQQDRIHVLEEHLYCRPSPRLLEGLKNLPQYSIRKYSAQINCKKIGET